MDNIPLYVRVRVCMCVSLGEKSATEKIDLMQQRAGSPESMAAFARRLLRFYHRFPQRDTPFTALCNSGFHPLGRSFAVGFFNLPAVPLALLVNLYV